MIAFVCSRLYSPECVEGEFCELRVYGVLRSSLPASNVKDSHVAYVSLPASLLECPRSMQRARRGTRLPSTCNSERLSLTSSRKGVQLSSARKIALVTGV